MAVKAYYHRYGAIDYDEYDTVEEAKRIIEFQEELGECFGDCIVDENGIVVYDFDTERNVIGRETPESRVGKKYN